MDPLTIATLSLEVVFSVANPGRAMQARLVAVTMTQSHILVPVFISFTPFVY
jgi:hypothetical protein